jgi:hypothetical protein
LLNLLFRFYFHTELTLFVRHDIAKLLLLVPTLLPLSAAKIKELHRFVSACECIQFTSTFGKSSGIFKSPDYPNAYDNNIECLLYSFVARRDQLVELAFRTFDVQKTQLE